ncbi:MAG: nitroreductase/quinone reductase family protein, partial [Dermatophilaceae bacterium]
MTREMSDAAVHRRAREAPTVERVYRDAVNRFSATGPGSWLVRRVAARVDPHLFRWSRGRMTITGVPTLPMLVLTTTGRHSGRPRSVQLAHLAEPGGTWLVVGSAMGQDHDPDWVRNLRAEPRAHVILPG